MPASYDNHDLVWRMMTTAQYKGRQAVPYVYGDVSTSDLAAMAKRMRGVDLYVAALVPDDMIYVTLTRPEFLRFLENCGDRTLPVRAEAGCLFVN